MSRAVRISLAIGVVATMAAVACDLQPQPLPPVDRGADEEPTSGNSKGNDSPTDQEPEPMAPATQGDGGDGGSSLGDGGDAGPTDAG